MPSQLPTIQRATLEEQVYQALRTAILQQDFEGGARLVQEEVATKLGTSRIPVRDALRKLEAEGLVIADGRGTYRVTTFGIEDAVEVYGMRALLEPYAAVQAVPRLTPALLDELADMHFAMNEAAGDGDLQRYVTLNARFHMTLYETSGYRRLVRSIRSLWSGIPPLTPLSVPGQLERSIAEHGVLLGALQASDPVRVDQIVKAHVANAGAALVAHLRRS